MENLNLLHGTVTVVESISEVSGRIHFVTPKNHRSRVVPLPRYLRQMLNDYLGTQPAKGPRDWVFTTGRGNHLRHTHFYASVFRPAVLAAGLPASTRFHDLRHTAASLWLAEGNPINAVKDWLGHSTVQVTVDRYGHLLPGAEEAANEKADAAWRAAQQA